MESFLWLFRLKFHLNDEEGVEVEISDTATERQSIVEKDASDQCGDGDVQRSMATQG